MKITSFEQLKQCPDTVVRYRIWGQDPWVYALTPRYMRNADNIHPVIPIDNEISPEGMHSTWYVQPHTFGEYQFEIETVSGDEAKGKQFSYPYGDNTKTK